MTNVTVVGTPTENPSGATLTEPTGVAQGDFLLAIAGRNGTTLPSTPSGWTLLDNGQSTSPGSGQAIGLYYIFRGASAPSYTFTNATDGSVIALRGADSTPFDAAGHAVTSTSTSSPSVTPSLTNEFLVCLINNISGGAATTPAGMTSQLAGSDTDIATLQLSASGATGTKSWGGTSSHQVAFSIAIRPLQATTVTKTATFDAALANRQTVSATADAVFANLVTKSATFDMAAAHPTLKTAVTDAVFAALHTKAATFDADLMQTQFRTALADAVFARLTTKAATTDAVFAQHPTVTALADAVFANLVTKSATTDAAFANLRTVSATFDADLSGQVFKTATFDAVFGYPELLPAGTATVVNSPMAGTATLAHLPPGTATLPKLPPGSAVL